jgi:hypothetical protein
MRPITSYFGRASSQITGPAAANAATTPTPTANTAAEVGVAPTVRSAVSDPGVVVPAVTDLEQPQDLQTTALTTVTARSLESRNDADASDLDPGEESDCHNAVDDSWAAAQAPVAPE